MASSLEAIQKILQETVAPGISRLEIELAGVKADVRSLQSEIRRLDDKIDSVRGELKAEIHHLDDKLTTALEIRERLAALEAKVAAH
jgi:predicted  nucleic acid-binding Zn-ribbon protein